MSRQVLNRAVAFKLARFIEERYAVEAVTDGAFAKIATDTLGIPITERNVAGVRADLEIPPTKPRGILTSTKKLCERINDIEARLTKLEKEWNV